MCGRYTLTVSGRILAELFDLDQVPPVVARYNVAPSQQVLVVRGGAGGARQWAETRWGLVPAWAKEVDAGARLVNARAETVADKPSFRSALKQRRCLVPADGFYEWKAADAGKEPHLIRFADGRAFAFAGLWEVWRGGGDPPLESCTIITTTPNEVVAALHDRMPVILPREGYAEWLAPGGLARERLAQLLAPYPASGMESFRVSSRVNNPRVDDPACAASLPA